MKRAARRGGGLKSHKLNVAATLALAAAFPTVGLAADSWSIQLGIRETGVAGTIGSNGGTSGAIEWITDSANPTIAAGSGPLGTWQQFTFNFDGTDPITSFTGNGVIDGTMGVLEEIRIVNSGGNSGANLNLRIDDIFNNTTSGSTLITGFETGQPNPNGGANLTFAGNVNDAYMFREPLFSGTTSANMGPGVNSTLTSTTFHGGISSLAARWTFVPNGNTSQWLRLATTNSGVLPNPIIDISSTSSVSIWLNMLKYQPTGARAEGIDVSQNQGTGIDWNRVGQPASAGGGGRQFAFIRATRGGTSGTSSTGSNRVDDTTYAYNVAGSKAAGILTGVYHFGKPGLWTAASAGSLVDHANTAITPEDEARHFLEIAGNTMKVGYMRPVYDLEEDVPGSNNAQLTNYVKRFVDHIIKYKGPAAACIIYTGGNFSSNVNSGSGLENLPLWYPNFAVEAAWDSGNPPSQNYGIWDDFGDPQPWKFWQYSSPDVYIPGVGAGTHNDIDVAHGDLNFVKQYLIQGAIWDGSGGNTWTTASSWDTNAVPTSSTELLLNLGTPATITVASGQNASGIYFADNYTLNGGSIALSNGRIDVDASKTATLQTNLSAPSGFRKVGTGTMTHASGTSTVTGVADILQGTMSVSGGSIAVSGNLLVDPELTQFDKGVVAPLPSSAAQITSSTLNINGGAMTAPAAFVGGSASFSGAIGTLNVSSGSLTVSGALKIWNSAVNFVDSKVNLTGGTLSVGSLDTNGDTASLNWTAGTFAVTGAGGFSVATAGPVGSTLTIGAGKTLNVTNTLSVGTSSVVNLSNTGGTVIVGALDTSGDATRFNWTAGTLTVNGAGGLAIQSGGPFSTALTVGTSKTLNVTNTLTVGSSSTLTLSGTGVVAVGNIDLGGVSTRLSWSGGTLTHNGPGSSDLGTRTIGSGGAAQILNINGGSVTTASAIVGALSAGTVNHSGGTHTVSTTLSIGVGGMTGTHNVSGSAVLNVNGSLAVGGSGTPGSTGIMSISGGTVTTPTLKIWNTGAAAPGGTRLNLTGGILNVQSIDLTSNPARLNLNGGTLNYNGAGASDLTGLAIAAGTLNVNSGSIIGSTAMTTAAPANINVTGTGTLSAPVVNAGAMAVSGGGTIDGAVTNNGTFSVNSGGTFSGVVTNNSTFTINNGGTVSGFATNTNAASGIVNVNNGATLSAPLDNNGIMNVASGIVGGAIDNVGTMNVTGTTATFNGPVDSAGTINVNSPANVAFNVGIAGPGTMNLAVGANATSPVVAFGTLNVHGTWTLAPDWPAAAMIAGTLNVTGTLNLANNDGIVLDTPLGTWNGTAYNGVNGMLAANKITSSAGGLTRLAAAEAGAVNKTTFAGWPVDPDDVLIMFSYGGDADLSGFIDADDYFQIDASYNDPTPSLNYNKGDFNLDGVINGDDFAIIDASFSGQGPPFVPGAIAEGVRVVPEPSSIALLALGLSGLRRQRRSAAR